jgi:hypothetical protein
LGTAVERRQNDDRTKTHGARSQYPARAALGSQC